MQNGIFAQKVENSLNLTILRSPGPLRKPMLSWSFFQSARSIIKVPAHFTKKSGIPLFLAFRSPEVHFLGQNATSGPPA